MDVFIQQTSWYSLEAWVLENENLRTVIVPDLGAKLASLVDKRSGLEWLVGPADRPVKKITYGASFTEQDMSGWDEMFPTIVACNYPGPGERSGAPLPDHGEVWALPWTVSQASDGKLTLSVEGYALPYCLTRTAQYTAPDVLQLDYQLVNLGQEKMPYIWAAHPQFACGLEAEVVLPPHITEVCNTIPNSWGWGEPETRFGWPAAIGVDGESVRIDRVGPPSLHQARKFFLTPDMRAGWAGLIRRPSRDWLRLEWDPNLVPYLGLWVDEGVLNPESVAAPEPTTGYYDSLAVAWSKKQVTVIEPRAVITWRINVRVGTGEQPFPG